MREIINPLSSSGICKKCPVERSCVVKSRIPNCAAQFFYNDRWDGPNKIDWNTAIKNMEAQPAEKEGQLFTWCGKPNTELSRKELLDMIICLQEQINGIRKTHAHELEMLS